VSMTTRSLAPAGRADSKLSIDGSDRSALFCPPPDEVPYPVCRTGSISCSCGGQPPHFIRTHLIMLDYLGSGISRVQTFRLSIEWDTCAPINHAANFPYSSDACLISEINWGIDRGSVLLLNRDQPWRALRVVVSNHRSHQVTDSESTSILVASIVAPT
jgi:hypothetical protein